MKLNLKLNTRKIVIGVIVVVVLAIIAGVVVVATAPKAPPPNIIVVKRGDISASVNAQGKVRAKRSATLAIPLSGVVGKIEKAEGDAVNAGQVILSLRADDTVRRVKQTELSLQVRQLDLARAKAAPRDEDIDIARANLRKATMSVALAEANYNSNPTTQNEVAREYARADLEIARASFNRTTNGAAKEELDALQAGVTAAQLELDSARQQLELTKLTAPFTGTVTAINVREGELVGGYSPLAAMADLSALEIIADVDEIDVANVQVGQKVDVRFDAFPGEPFSGTLTRLFPSATPQRGSTVYSIIVDFDAKNFKVRPGMGANLKIQTVEKKNVLIVPNRALKNIGMRKAVRILGPGEPRDAIVETGVTDGVNSEIISGVNEGDQLQIN